MRPRSTSIAMACGALLCTGVAAHAAAPPNDARTAPFSVTPANLPYSNVQNVTDATRDTTDPAYCDSNTTGSVWYSFAAGANTIVEIDTGGSNFPTQLTVFRQTAPNSFSGVDCASASGGPNRAQLTLDALAGATYLVKVNQSSNAGCPVGGCQLSMKISQARQHQVELRLNDTSTSPCGGYASLSAYRSLASDSQYKSSSTGTVKATVVGVGTDFSLYGYAYAYNCGTGTPGPVMGSLFIDGVRVGKVENMLPRSRGFYFSSSELQDGASPSSSPAANSDPDAPTGTRTASMVAKSDPECSVRAYVDVSRYGPQGSESWSVSRARIGRARVATVTDPSDYVSYSFSGYRCSDGGKVKGTAQVDGVTVGSGWLRLRSAYAELDGTVPSP